MFSPSSPQNWDSSLSEGQLSVDVFRDGDSLVIRSTAAGADPDQLDISFHGDLLTIRGVREADSEVAEEDWFYRECYWGAFSRSIVLPYDVVPERAEATIKNGILEIRLPITASSERSIKVKVRD
jgi:HSP20 family protein